MDNQSLQKIRDSIAQAQNVAVAVSGNPDIDQMAAALSLYLTLNNQGKKVSVLSPTEPIVELSSLVGIDKVRMSNEGSGGDLVVSFPYREGEIEKVSYTIESGFLNIVVKAGEQGLTFDEQDVLFKRGGGKPDLVVTVGAASMADLDALFSEDALKDVTIINIDNNNNNEGFGDVVLVSPKFSSLSEQVADLMLNLGMDIDIDVAQNLLSGITAATSNFQSPNTSYLAFEIAAILMKRGAVRVRDNAPQQMQAPRQEDRREASRDQGQNRQHQLRGSNTQNQSQNQNQNQGQNQNQNQQRQEQIRQALRQGQQNRQPDQQNRQSDQQKPPSDWLTPKVYKGSTSV
jgi:nanoRNase/pAp phosphatase (c-di-AMP/oligoRNAs hydrolase)